MSWKKVKLGDVCTIEKGKTGIQKAIPGDFPLVVTAEERKSHNEYQFDDEAVIIPLVSGTGHGHASIKRLHFQSGKFALGSILCAVIPKDKSILNAEYLFRFLNLNKERELVDRMKGMANVTLPIKEIAKIEIPLPSLEEQIEFVEKYGLLEMDSEAISSEVDHQLNLIKQLRQAFLREAMQGKLVKSTNTKETGQQLLEKIKAEKQKSLPAGAKRRQEKELPPITEDEIPFEIPAHWAWCRLGDAVNEVADVDHKMPEKKNEGIPYISPRDFYGKNEIDFDNAKKISEDDYVQLSRKIKPEKFDIIFPRYGTIGVNRFLEENIKFLPSYSCVTIKTNKTFTFPKYIFYYSISPFSKIEIKRHTVQTTQPNVGIKSILEFRLPLPPLQEQEQIVAKLEELMAFCDGLEQSIKESQGYNEMLLQQVLREALQGETSNND